MTDKEQVKRILAWAVEAWKVCSRCGVEKNITEFHLRRDRTSGFQSRCKLCLRETDRNRRMDCIRVEYDYDKSKGYKKVCVSCQKKKSAACFGRRRSSRDGLYHICKDCLAIRSSVARKDKGPVYYVWRALISRCHNPADKRFIRYGGRGISVCERWKHSFDSFMDDMGPKPTPTHQIDRINNDGNYEPGNCKWSTRTENIRNNSRTRLNEASVKEILLQKAGGARTCDIAHHFGVSQSAISHVVARRSWSDVTM